MSETTLDLGVRKTLSKLLHASREGATGDETKEARVTSARSESFEVELGHGVLVTMDWSHHAVGIRATLARVSCDVDG